MFDRRKYKSFALKQLKGRWTVPVLITLIIIIISFIFEIPIYFSLFSTTSFWDLINYTGGDIDEILDLYTSAVNSASTYNFITYIQLVVNAILEVAAISVYLKMSRSPEKVSFSSFFEGLNKWGKAILAVLWQFLWIVLWSLLFLIPGIIKSFAYSQMFFLISEYKDLSVTKSMKISMIITKGHKWDLFVTYLSFLGWSILCVFTLGIGTLWLTPYMNMTLTNAYHAMLKEAIESGKIKPEDLTE